MNSNIKIFISSPSIRLVQEFAKRVTVYKPNVLITYYDIYPLSRGDLKPTRYTIKNRERIGELMLDCGAFSLHQEYRNRSEDERERASDELFEAYKAYTELAHEQYDHIISMDDRFDLDSMEHNLGRLHEMEDIGVNAIPVIHNIYDPNEISYFIDNEYDMVAIGQCKGRDDLHVLYPVVDRLYQAGIKVHLFGKTTPKIINHVPLYSCDSKTFLDYGTRGKVLYWNPENKGLDKTDVIYFPKYQEKPDEGKGYYYHEYKYLDDFKRYIAHNLDLDFEAFKTDDGDFYRELVNMLYFANLEYEVNNSPLLP